VQIKRARLGLLAAGAGSGTDLMLCFRIRPLPKSRLAECQRAASFLRSIFDFDWEYYLLSVCAALAAAGAIFIVFFAM
jgi:hypothetical protein